MTEFIKHSHEVKMETIEIILLIVSVNLVTTLLTNYTSFRFKEKQRDDTRLVLAFLENNEKDRIEIIRDTIPSIKADLIDIRSKTDTI